MPQFDNWPADDLRLYKQNFDNGESIWLVYSFQMDALTPVNEEEIWQLQQKEVQEIDKLPEQH